MNYNTPLDHSRKLTTGQKIAGIVYCLFIAAVIVYAIVNKTIPSI